MGKYQFKVNNRNTRTTTTGVFRTLLNIYENNFAKIING